MGASKIYAIATLYVLGFTANYACCLPPEEAYLSSISSPRGSLVGGLLPVTICGGDFSESSRVFFGEIEANQTTYAPDTGCLTSMPPLQRAGVVDLRVINPSLPRYVREDGYEYSENIVFGVIGDYGFILPGVEAVAGLIKSWGPDFVITAGDNNYAMGSQTDEITGQLFHSYLYPYSGLYGAGAPDRNRFFPSLGNHDWWDDPGLQSYYEFFSLPGNERYYEYAWGPVRLFVISSDLEEPDGRTVDSVQAAWLQAALARATEPWKIVYMHESPYCSGPHGSSTDMQWPYKAWGADAVIAGHNHLYERLEKDGLPYFVNGAGGVSLYGFVNVLPESIVRYNQDFGAMRVEAGTDMLNFRFISVGGEIIDDYTLHKTAPPAVIGFAPPSGSIAGGDLFTISGSGFQSGAVVDMGGMALRNVVVESPNIIRGRTPKRTKETHFYPKVINPETGQSAAAPYAYHAYAKAPLHLKARQGKKAKAVPSNLQSR